LSRVNQGENRGIGLSRARFYNFVTVRTPSPDIFGADSIVNIGIGWDVHMSLYVFANISWHPVRANSIFKLDPVNIVIIKSILVVIECKVVDSIT
jgi:hypothetical protein